MLRTTSNAAPLPDGLQTSPIPLEQVLADVNNSSDDKGTFKEGAIGS